MKRLLERLQTYMVLIQGNLEKFISIIHNLVIDFVHNYKAGTKLWCQIWRLLKDVRFFCTLFLETTVLFSYYGLICQPAMQPHLNYWSVRHTVERFLSEYVLNVNGTVDVVQEERLRCCFCFRNELWQKVSMQQPAYLTWASYTCK